MSAYVALDGVPVIFGAIILPFSGIWMADLVLAEPKDLSGKQTLTLSDATYTCTPVRAVSFSGARGVRVVGGAGGWAKGIPAKAYANGIKLSAVLSDVASAAGEQLVLDADKTLGQFIRPQGPASKTLQMVLGAAWWMDPLGVVQTKARDTSPIGVDYTAIRVTGASGLWEIATEDVAAWTPGRSFRGPTSSGVISRVEHKVSKGMLRTVVLSE